MIVSESIDGSVGGSAVDQANDRAGDEVCRLPAVEQAKLIRSQQISARELLDAHVSRIERFNPTLNAVVGMDLDVANARAAAVDEAIAANRRIGPLAGLVTAHKDLVDTADFVSTHGSPIHAERRPSTDDPLVTRVKEAGAVALGKTNTPEFGAGSHTFNPVYGTTVNPYDHGRSAGGSSGGAAVALRAGMVSIADGSDYGGSLRNPAAWNNVVGFRPTPRVVAGGGRGNAWNPGPILGPMARSVDDVILLLRVLAEPDLRDPLHRPINLPPAVSPPNRPPRVAWSSTLGGLPIEPEIAAVVERFKSDLEILGWEAEEAEPDFTGADECFVTLRAFHFLGDADALERAGDQVKATIQDEIARGRKLTATELSKAYAHLNVMWKRAVEFFSRYDLLIAPVTQVSPFPIDVEYPTEVAGVQMGSYIEWMRSCCRITAMGCPAVSLPAGFTADDGPNPGLPVGIQLIGRPFGDADLLRMAKALEATTGYGRQWPPDPDGTSASRSS